MDQRQLRLGDILDDYCPRERRVTNHAVVAMVGTDVKQTRCTTCDTEHEFKHAKVPRQHKKIETPAALFAHVAAGAPKRVVHDPPDQGAAGEAATATRDRAPEVTEEIAASGGEEMANEPVPKPQDAEPGDQEREDEDGPVHRPLIRAALPRPGGQPPPQRPLPEFTIRQPGGRQNRFRPRNPRGAGVFQGNRSNGNSGGGSSSGPMRSGGGTRQGGGGRSPQGGAPPRFARRDGPGRKRSK